MATASYKEDMRPIFEEMKQRFPQVPDHIIQKCVSQCQSDRIACCRLLEKYISPSQNTIGVYRNMEVPIGWQNYNSSSNGRSVSFSSAGSSTGANQDNNIKPQSAPVESRYSRLGDLPPPYSSYYVPSTSQQYHLPPPKYYVNTLEIPAQHKSQVELQLQSPPRHTNPQLSISITTNGPVISGPRALNTNYPVGGARSPRTRHRTHVSPTPGSDREALIDALLSYQGVRHQQLYRELALSKETLQKLQREVSTLEESLLKKTPHVGGNMKSPSGEVLRTMRDEITKLRVECHCLAVEVDICSKEQNQQGGDFYQNIFPGQVGPIPPVPTRLPTSDNNGNQVEDNEGSKWKCFACTFHNHPALNTCEMCEMPRKIID